MLQYRSNSSSSVHWIVVCIQVALVHLIVVFITRFAVSKYTRSARQRRESKSNDFLGSRTSEFSSSCRFKEATLLYFAVKMHVALRGEPMVHVILFCICAYVTVATRFIILNAVISDSRPDIFRISYQRFTPFVCAFRMPFKPIHWTVHPS
jgi:hypothetical protein